MDNLIKALEIFRKYGNPTCPTHCEHDELWVMIEHENVTFEDLMALEKLGFTPHEEYFTSGWFGSA